jgi:hypothetical protein
LRLPQLDLTEAEVEYPGYFMEEGVLGVLTPSFIEAWNKLNRVVAIQDRAKGKYHEVMVIHLAM